MSQQKRSTPLSVGVDIVEIGRIRAAVERWGKRFLKRVYTEGEVVYSRGRAPQLAARFAAKEATMKALGTGRRGVAWREVEVANEASGAPILKLHGRAVQRARVLGLQRFAISISHSRDYAVAFVIADQGDAL
jgi:holo-[acyl-carrier protein] synthase